MIIKEYSCPDCSKDFEGVTSVCPMCGSMSRRVFRTAPNISTGNSKKTDAILEDNFKAMGISNYSNVNGYKISWRDRQNVSMGDSVAAGFADIRNPSGAEVMQTFSNSFGVPVPNVPNVYKPGQTVHTDKNPFENFKSIEGVNINPLKSKTEIATSKGVPLDDNYGK